MAATGPTKAVPPSLTQAARQLEVTHLSQGVLMGSIGHVCLVIWQTKPTLELFGIQRRELTTAVAADPGRVLSLCIIEAKTDPPDQDVRDPMAKLITKLGRNLAGCAVVIEGSGFRSAITRTVLTGLTLVVRTPVPYRFFESTSPACDWLSARAGGGKLHGLLEQVELARTRLNDFNSSGPRLTPPAPH